MVNLSVRVGRGVWGFGENTSTETQIPRGQVVCMLPQYCQLCTLKYLTLLLMLSFFLCPLVNVANTENIFIATGLTIFSSHQHAEVKGATRWLAFHHTLE